MNFRNQRLGHYQAADYTLIRSRTFRVTGNHVMYDRGAWFLRVIMSSSRALCCLPSVKKQKHDFQVCFVDRARHRKNSWRQGLTNTKRSTKVAKELFADDVKEKKLREPEEKKEFAQTLKFYVEARKKGFVQCIIKQLLHLSCWKLGNLHSSKWWYQRNQNRKSRSQAIVIRRRYHSNPPVGWKFCKNVIWRTRSI